VSDLSSSDQLNLDQDKDDKENREDKEDREVKEYKVDREDIGIKDIKEDKDDKYKENVLSFRNKEQDINYPKILYVNPESDKNKYKQFLQVFLKVKFEHFHNTNISQQINAKDVWNVWKISKNKSIDLSNMKAYILNELKNTDKYLSKTSLKDYNSLKTISEENQPYNSKE